MASRFIASAVVLLWGCSSPPQTRPRPPATPKTGLGSLQDVGPAEAPVLPQVSLGMSHSCLLLDGTAWCWGYDNRGQLGDGKARYFEAARLDAVEPLKLGARVTQIVAGSETTCALLEGGAVRCWGIGELGQHGTMKPYDLRLAEEATDAIIGGPATHVVADGLNTCALLETGNVRCWGTGEFAGLGYGRTDVVGDDETPASVGDVPLDGRVVQLDLGGHTCVLLEGGSIQCWGTNYHGKLGYGHTQPIGDDETPADAGKADVGGRALQVAVGGQHTCALLEGGRVRCWGWGHHGALGYGNKTSIGEDGTPASAGDVNVGGRVVQLAAGRLHTCALLEGGRVRCWGLGSRGRLGYGNKESIGDDEEPATAGDVDVGGKAVAITAGEDRTCAILGPDRFRCWGENGRATLGYPHTNDIGDDETPASAGDVPLPTP